MAWETVGGEFIINWYPSALLLTAWIAAALILMRSISLNLLLASEEFRERPRYIRGARHGWIVVVGAFAAVVAVMIGVFDYTHWNFAATAIAWAAALLPVAGSAGLLMIEEFMGFWVGGQVLWNMLHRERFDLIAYRSSASHTASSSGRWAYYAAWVAGSLSLTVGPVMWCVGAV